MVDKRNCNICIKCEERRKNYTRIWIVGEESVCASNVQEYTQMNQHALSIT